MVRLQRRRHLIRLPRMVPCREVVFNRGACSRCREERK